MATMDQRMLSVEAEVNQLKGAYDHLATKSDLANLKVQLLLAQITIGSIVVAVLKFWQ